MSEWDCLMNVWVSVVWLANFVRIFVKRKFSVNNFGSKIEALGDPGWSHIGIQNHAVEVNAQVHQQRSRVVFGSHGKKTIFRVSG